MNLIRELKRRNVFRMAGLYLVGAWLLVQIASTLFPAFGVPGWALRGLVIVLALGFIPAVIFAWVFEFTPDGIKRDEEVAPGQSIAPQTAQRMNRLIIAGLMLALCISASTSSCSSIVVRLPRLRRRHKSPNPLPPS